MAVTTFRNLPLADHDRQWDGAAAEKRVRHWADAEDSPNERYRDAHLWYDADSKDNFTGYKMLIADVVNGRLVAVPHAIMAAGGILEGAHGGIDVPDHDRSRLRGHLAKYYAKMDHSPPWDT